MTASSLKKITKFKSCMMWKNKELNSKLQRTDMKSPTVLRDKEIETCLSLNQKLRGATAKKQRQKQERVGQLKPKPRPSKLHCVF